MQGLGYERYGAGGGDWGAAVTTYMALEAPERLLGIHLSNLDNAPPPTTPLTAAERAFVAATDHWDATQRGYSFIQGTKPQTLAYGLTDSPAGLAAWILEKWRSLGRHRRRPERFDRDFLLTLVTLYWVTNTISTAEPRLHRQPRRGHRRPRPSTSTVPHRDRQLPPQPRQRGRPPARVGASASTPSSASPNMPRGGHFAAAEEPDLLAADITAFFAP